MATLERFAQMATISGERFWDFLEVRDVLNLSVCARATAGLVVPQSSLNRIIAQTPKVAKIGRLTLRFPGPLSTGMVRRVLHRVADSQEGTLLIDDRNGRIVLDIGSAFHDNEAHLAAAAPLEDGEEEDVEAQQIFKQLELCSFDEYDDFNPRHPLPKDRAHRRGDSYFNSDIEMVVGEVGNMDLSAIAKAALAGGDDESVPTAPVRASSASNNTATAAGGADKPPVAPKLSAKDRILAKTKNHVPGRPPLRTQRERDVEDE